MEQARTMQSVEDLRAALHEVAPNPTDPLELAALSESLGVTDSWASRLGYETVFDCADHLFDANYRDRRRPARVRDPAAGFSLRGELLSAGSKLSVGLAYSLPWMLMTVIEMFFPHVLEVPPAMGSILTLSIIASLVTTGGFAQAIMRDTTSFLALKEPQLARRSAVRLMRYGFTTAISLAVAGLFVGLYFNLFEPRYIVLAALHYLLFCVLWMLCGALSGQGLSLLLPIVLLVPAGALVGMRLSWHIRSVPLLLLWPLLCALVATLCWSIASFRSERAYKDKVCNSPPQEVIHRYLLLPTILYGSVYFSFLFADRLAAGSAIPWAYGLTFGIDPVYKRAMDLHLFAFLLATIFVEYLSDLFTRSWWLLAGLQQQTSTATLSLVLRKRYAMGVSLIGACFVILLVCVIHYLPAFMGLPGSRALTEILWFGGAAYLVLSTTLFGSVVLLSVNAAKELSRAGAIGLLVNIFVGYTLSHAIAVQFASVGLCAGAFVFAWQVHRAVWNKLEHPDYYFSLA